MKITRIEPIVVALPYEHGAPKRIGNGIVSWDTFDIMLVRVDTDAGLTGWGEAFGIGWTELTSRAIGMIARLAVGRDCSDPPALSAALRRATHSTSRAGGPLAYAISGLDIALWDIAGKATGRPVWRLLGGADAPPRARLPAYASLFRIGEPRHVASVTAAAVARGYRSVKLHEHTPEAVAAARAAAGKDVEITVDVNCHWTSAAEIADIARQLAPYDIGWLEEPLYPADAYELLAEARQACNAAGVMVAGGENLGNLNDLRAALRAGAVDIVQPSVAKIGGISELWQCVQHAAGRGMRLVPHSPFIGPALVAAIHVGAAMPGEGLVEHRYCDLLANPLGEAVVACDGHLPVPQGPGLGIEPDLDVIERFRRSLA